MDFTPTSPTGRVPKGTWACKIKPVPKPPLQLYLAKGIEWKWIVATFTVP